MHPFHEMKDTSKVRIDLGFTVNVKGLTSPTWVSIMVIISQDTSCLKIRIQAFTNQHVKVIQNICTLEI